MQEVQLPASTMAAVEANSLLHCTTKHCRYFAQTAWRQIIFVWVSASPGVPDFPTVSQILSRPSLIHMLSACQLPYSIHTHPGVQYLLRCMKPWLQCSLHFMTILCVAGSHDVVSETGKWPRLSGCNASFFISQEVSLHLMSFFISQEAAMHLFHFARSCDASDVFSIS